MGVKTSMGSSVNSCDGFTIDMMVTGDLEERRSAFQGAAFLQSNEVLHVKLSKIQCLKWVESMQ